MQAAGINPSFGINKGGNSSEGGASSRSEAEVNIAAAMDMYQSMATGTAQRQLIREQTANVSANTIKTASEAAILQPDAVLGRSGEYNNAYTRARMSELGGRRFTAEHTEDLYRRTAKGFDQSTNTAAEHARMMDSQTRLNEQQMMNAWYAKKVAPYVNSGAHAVRGVTGRRGGW
jgi:hypothetical protein